MITGGTYCKALLLVIVFSLNTVVSSACSFSSLVHKAHHQPEKAHHEHSHGKKHEHRDSHEHSKDHNESSKEDCCSRNVIALEKMDKSPGKIIEASPKTYVSVIVVSDFFASPVISSGLLKTNFPRHIRWRPPVTIQNLRIVIQSFQI